VLVDGGAAKQDFSKNIEYTASNGKVLEKVFAELVIYIY